MTDTTTKRKRGRPVGSKDTVPRYRAGVPRVATEPSLTVEQKIGRLNSPMKVSTLAKIFGMSPGVLRKRIRDGHLRAFDKDGITCVEPADALSFWRSGVDRRAKRDTLLTEIEVSSDPTKRVRQIRNILENM
jgi:hypothetical protein